jgi:hypothetical protein
VRNLENLGATQIIQSLTGTVLALYPFQKDEQRRFETGDRREQGFHM